MHRPLADIHSAIKPLNASNFISTLNTPCRYCSTTCRCRVGRRPQVYRTPCNGQTATERAINNVTAVWMSCTTSTDRRLSYFVTAKRPPFHGLLHIGGWRHGSPGRHRCGRRRSHWICANKRICIDAGFAALVARHMSSDVELRATQRQVYCHTTQKSRPPCSTQTCVVAIYLFTDKLLEIASEIGILFCELNRL